MKERVAQTPTARAAAYFAGLRYEDLPPDSVSTVKAILLDTLGTALAANTLGDGCAELVSLARGAKDAREATLLGFGDRVPALTAALVNGGLAHALNYDAVGPAHLGLIPPAALAAAERAGGVSGRQLVAAIAAGCELSARLGATIGTGHPTALLGQLLGYFGCAAAAGRVMGLSPAQMHSALGLVLMQAAGMRQVVIEGDPPAKAIYGAFSNHGGLLAALLAQQGLDCRCDALEGEAGLPALVGRDTQQRLEIDTAFGARFYLLDATFKPWPVSGHVTPFIEAALQIARSHSLRAQDIGHVRLRAAPAARAWLEPAEQRRRPATAAAAANSIYFGVAKAFVNGGVSLRDFTPAGLAQPEALAFADRINHELDDALLSAGRIEVTTTGGDTHALTLEAPLGSPSRPMSWERLVEKFRDCAKFAAGTITPDRLDETIALVERLEEVPDVSIIPALLQGSLR
ncbi:MAG TPA: MmgE/PrpD family protein [Dehalococcoidia bacterium]|nr:MmgE/PrpD family protein [Dehalococcoidia bacterium]